MGASATGNAQLPFSQAVTICPSIDSVRINPVNFYTFPVLISGVIVFLTLLYNTFWDVGDNGAQAREKIAQKLPQRPRWQQRPRLSSNTFAKYKACLLLVLQLSIVLVDGFSLHCLTALQSVTLVMPTITVAALLIYSIADRQAPTSVKTYLVWICLADISRTWNYKVTAMHWIASSFAALSALVNADILLAYSYMKYPGSVSEVFRNIVSDEYVEEPTTKSLREQLGHLVVFGFCDMDSESDLPPLPDVFDALQLSESLEEEWGKVDHSIPHNFLKSVLRANRWWMADIIPPRLCYLGLRVYLVYLMRRLLIFSRDREHDITDTPGNIAVSMFVTLILMMIVSVWTANTTKRLDTTMSVMLNSQVMSMQLNLPARLQDNDHAVDRTELAVKQIMQSMNWFHDVWLAPVEIVIGLALFFIFEGAVAFAMVLFLVFGLLVSLIFGKKVINDLNIVTDITNRRVSETEQLILQLKGLQVQGLQHFLPSFLKPLRIEEISQGKRNNLYLIAILLSVLGEDQGSRLAVLAAGMFFSSSFTGMNPVNIFTAVVLVSLVVEPSFYLIRGMPQLNTVISAFNHMQKFLTTPVFIPRRSFVDFITVTDHAQFDTDSGVNVQSESEGEDEDENGAVEFDNVSITASPHSSPILQNVSFIIELRSLVTVSGPSGSGKSLLLKSMNNTAFTCNGEIRYSHDTVPISYCDKTPWLQKGTIRQNIIGNLRFRELRYNAIVDACCLRDDANALTDWDSFQVGRNGYNLTICQKQRVALARALYRLPGLLLLDDIFSNFDEDISSKIFAALFGLDGLVRSRNCSTFLVTSSLKHQQAADQGIFINTHRSVNICHGRRNIQNYLLENSHIIEEDVNKTKAEDEVWAELEILPSSIYDPEAPQSCKEFAQPHFQAVALNHKQTQNPLSSNVSTNSTEPNLKTVVTKKQPRMNCFQMARFYFSSMSVFERTLWVFSVVILVSLERFLDVIVYLARYFNMSEATFFKTYLSAMAVEFFISAFEGWLYLLVFTPRCALQVHQTVLESVSNRYITFAGSKEEYFLLRHIATDMTTVSDTIPLAFKRVLYSLCMCLVDVLLICYGIPVFIFISPFYLIALYFIQAFYRRQGSKIQRLYDQADADFSAAEASTKRDQEYIIYDNWHSDHLSGCIEAADHRQRVSGSQAMLESWSTLYLHMMMACIIMTITLLAAVLEVNVYTSGLSLALAFSFWLVVVMQKFLRRLSTLDSCQPMVDRLARLSASSAEATQGKVEPPASWPQRGEIVLSDAESFYRSPTESAVAMSQSSFTIRAKEHLQVAGQASSGKSSFLATLMNLVQYSGSIKIDDIELSTIPRDRLVSEITSIPQVFVKLPGSVRDNAFPWDTGKPRSEQRVNDKAVAAVLQRVGLWDIVEEYGGIHSPLESVPLSITQEIQLSIARGILHHRSFGTKIILMDDATSGMLASEREEAQHVMGEEFVLCTVVSVAPERIAIPNITRLVRFRNGRASVVA